MEGVVLPNRRTLDYTGHKQDDELPAVVLPDRRVHDYAQQIKVQLRLAQHRCPLAAQKVQLRLAQHRCPLAAQPEGTQPRLLALHLVIGQVLQGL